MYNHAVYLISGLGADERAFKFLTIDCPHIIHLSWIKPLEEESLEGYCTRLSRQIDTTSGRRIILVGVSFGGIIAQEIARNVECAAIFIISSIKSKEEGSAPLRLLRKWQLHKILPAGISKAINGSLARYFFSTETEEEGKLLNAIIRDTDADVMKWAIGRIANWDSPRILDNVIHIHGTGDRIFPIKNIRNATRIGGGHFMIVNRAGEISDIINEYLRREATQAPPAI